jgi:hypothetical protein
LPAARPTHKAAKPKAKIPVNEGFVAAYEVKRKAEKALRDAYQAGDRSTPQLLAMHEVVEGVAALKARLEAATTAEEFQACADLANVELYEKASAFEWADPVGMFFMTDCRNYAQEAVEWFKWVNDSRKEAMAFWRALHCEKAGAYSGPSSYSLRPKHLSSLISESHMDAKKKAIRMLTAFQTGMF